MGAQLTDLDGERHDDTHAHGAGVDVDTAEFF